MAKSSAQMLKKRMEQWLDNPLAQGGLRSFANRYVRSESFTPAESIGASAAKLADPETRRATWAALRKGSDSVDGALFAAAAINEGSLESMRDACSIFGLDPKAPQWLALSALSGNTGMVRELLRAGVEPVDENGMPAIAFATHGGVAAVENKTTSIEWGAKKYGPTLRLLLDKSVMARMNMAAKAEALDAVGTNIERAMRYSFHGQADLGLQSHRSTVVALAKLWTSMPLEKALEARGASRLVFGAALGVFNKAWILRSERSDNLALPATVARSLLESLAARQDWAKAEAICQGRGWTLGSAAMDMANLGKGGASRLRAAERKATTECFEFFERLTGQSIVGAKGILEDCRLTSEMGPGPVLQEWIRAGHFIDRGEVPRVLRSFAAMARSTRDQKKGKETLAGFESEMSALFGAFRDGEMEAECSMLNRLANEWGMAEAPIKEEDRRSFLEAWGDKLDIAAIALEARQAQPAAAKKCRI